MRRRDVVAMLAGAAAWSQGAYGQASAPIIGMLSSGAPQPRRDQLDGFYAGLKAGGFVPGENVSIVQRGADDRYDRLPALAAELVHQRVSVIAIFGGPVAALAAKAATTSIPIVFAAVSDPVRSGLVASLNRPGGNLTGSAGLSTELDAKRLELLGELASGNGIIGALVNPNRPGVETQEQDLHAAAKAARREVVIFRAGDPQAIEAAFAGMTTQKISSLVVGADPFFSNNRQQIIILAARHAIIAVYQWREFPLEGGLVSYGPSIAEAYRLSGSYVGRILKGERPGELPVVQPSKFELVVNLKTARAIGLNVPPALLARADEVIE
jgi:putative tryptophan/tyrosine transport system substrate-binding protein